MEHHAVVVLPIAFPFSVVTLQAFYLCMLSRYTAPFNFDFEVAVIQWNFDFVCSEIDFTTGSHTLAMEVTRVANVFCTRLTRESFDDACYVSHLLTITQTFPQQCLTRKYPLLCNL